MCMLSGMMHHRQECIKSKVSGLYRRGACMNFAIRPASQQISEIYPTSIAQAPAPETRPRQSHPLDPAHLAQRRAKLRLHDMANSKRLRVQIDLDHDRIVPHLTKREHLPRTVGDRYHFHP